MDLRIACIALAHEATLLTRNIVDFTQVPACGLRTGWIEKSNFSLKSLSNPAMFTASD